MISPKVTIFWLFMIFRDDSLISYKGTKKSDGFKTELLSGSAKRSASLKGALRPKDKKKIGMSSGPVREFVPPLRPANFGSLFAGVGLRCGSRFRRVSANRDTLL